LERVVYADSVAERQKAAKGENVLCGKGCIKHFFIISILPIKLLENNVKKSSRFLCLSLRNITLWHLSEYTDLQQTLSISFPGKQDDKQE
jgi:hypothetical protein